MNTIESLTYERDALRIWQRAMVQTLDAVANGTYRNPAEVTYLVAQVRDTLWDALPPDKADVEAENIFERARIAEAQVVKLREALRAITAPFDSLGNWGGAEYGYRKDHYLNAVKLLKELETKP